MKSPVHGVVLATALLLVTLVPVRAQEEPIKLIGVDADMRKDASKALNGCPLKMTKPHGGINKNGVYTLNGDLFNNGHMYAILDHEPILICEWKHHRWTLKAAIKATAEWKSPGRNGETAIGREPDATKPFSLLTLQHQSLLVVSLSQEKYAQNYAALRFNPLGMRILDAIQSFAFYPMVKDGYLVTGDQSRNKAEWGAAYFSQIRHNKIARLKAWEEFLPYNQPDPSEFEGDVSFYRAQSGEESYTVMPDYSKDAHPADFVIFKDRLTLDGWRAILDAWKQHEIWAKLYFTPKRQNEIPDEEGEVAYIFSRLTGLPRSFYRITNRFNTREVGKNDTNIKVEGDADAVKLLTPLH